MARGWSVGARGDGPLGDPRRPRPSGRERGEGGVRDLEGLKGEGGEVGEGVLELELDDGDGDEGELLVQVALREEQERVLLPQQRLPWRGEGGGGAATDRGRDVAAKRASQPNPGR